MIKDSFDHKRQNHIICISWSRILVSKARAGHPGRTLYPNATPKAMQRHANVAFYILQRLNS